MITIIIGTNRPKAKSELVANLYKDYLSAAGLDSRILDLKGLPEDFAFSALYDNEGRNEEFNRFREWVEESRDLVFIIPEYNASFPGVLKTFIDGMKYPGTFNGKRCAMVGLSAGPMGGSLALSHFTDIANYLGMYVVPHKIYFSNIYQHAKDNQLVTQLYHDLIKEQVEAFKA